MALSHRSSRKIAIQNSAFSWALSQDSGFYVLIAQSESGQGKRLEIIIPWNANKINERNVSIDLNEHQHAVITPAIVKEFITLALDMGWNPNEKGSPAQLSLNNGNLEIRRGL